MAEDRRAHDRIDNLEKVVADHLTDHIEYQRMMAENTLMTQEIADNTAELVTIVKGARGLRSMLIWWGPVAAAVIALVVFLRDHWK